MSLSVVFLKSAEQDVKELKHYVIRRFGVETWQSTLSKLKESIHTLQAHPQAGKVPDELRTLNPGLFRQIISGMNRVIYEIRQETIYICPRALNFDPPCALNFDPGVIAARH